MWILWLACSDPAPAPSAEAPVAPREDPPAPTDQVAETTREPCRFAITQPDTQAIYNVLGALKELDCPFESIRTRARKAELGFEPSPGAEELTGDLHVTACDDEPSEGPRYRFEPSPALEKACPGAIAAVRERVAEDSLPGPTAL